MAATSASLRDQLDELCGGVGALVELSGQELGGEHRRVAEVRQVRGGVIHLRLAEHGRRGLFEELLGDALDVIAVDDAHLAQAIDAEDGLQFGAELLGFHVEAGLLLHVHAKNHENPFLRVIQKMKRRGERTWLPSGGEPTLCSATCAWMNYSVTSMPSDLASSASRSSISS